MAKNHEMRTLARRMAAQVLYESAITGDPAWDIAKRPDAIPDAGPLPDYAVELVRGVCNHEGEINRQLSGASKNWAIDRMPLVDRAIMSIAVFEMLYQDDVPASVAINEAVELARSFGGEDGSAGFVNGVLGNIARTVEAAAAPDAHAAAKDAG